jgi:hypothetical protein
MRVVEKLEGDKNDHSFPARTISRFKQDQRNAVGYNELDVRRSDYRAPLAQCLGSE